MNDQITSKFKDVEQSILLFYFVRIVKTEFSLLSTDSHLVIGYFIKKRIWETASVAIVTQNTKSQVQLVQFIK